MKITYLVTVLDGFGAALPIANVLTVMRDMGHEVDVVALMPKDRAACEKLEQAGIPYRFIGERPHQHVGPWLRLVGLLRAEKPDVLWTSMIQATVYGQIAGSLCGIPVVSWQHNAFLKPSNRRILRRTKTLTCRWVADSTAAAQFAVREIGLDADHVDVWPLFYADPDQPRARAWSPNEIFRFGSLGRLHPNKRYDVLIEALALIAQRNPEAAARMSFDIAGTGKQKDSLEALARARGVDNVHFVGYRADAFQFLSTLHGYVQPSRNEGLCIAAHEAMHAGLPVITTPVGELVNSIVPGETGWLCNTDDPDSLAEAILDVVKDPLAAKFIGDNAHKFVADKFSRENFQSSGRAILRRVNDDCSKSR